ncbi:MAG: Dam family site-specific DNA-(adenine-N6)-methyltransferase [Chloroflexi bacterium]|nr:Dam family site-specific DNA-(adenine-N6)-methyltransferase [Chloroflexota bacterium]
MTGVGEAPEMESVAARPFLKWAGGKTQILEELVARAPERIDTYYEPFLGGGALFFRLAADPERRPRRAVLNDLNRELIAAFRVVRDDAGALIEQLGELERSYLGLDAGGRGERYYAVREEYCELVADGGASDVEIAARLIFLNKTCFNGLYRVNRRGEFNVPHGRYARPRILDAPVLEAASAALAGVELLTRDFEEACAGAGPGDFVYFDPPFQPLSDTASFTAYTEGGFGRDDQLRLKWWVDELSRLGVPALVSNSADEWLLGVYEGGGYVASELEGAEPFWPDLGRAEEVETNRLINSRGDLRQDFVELLISNHALLAASENEKKS